MPFYVYIINHLTYLAVIGVFVVDLLSLSLSIKFNLLVKSCFPFVKAVLKLGNFDPRATGKLNMTFNISFILFFLIFTYQCNTTQKEYRFFLF